MANPPGNPNIRNIGFGSRPKEVDDEYRRRKKQRVWTKEKCIQQLEELMDILNKKIKGNDFKELQIIIDKMMDIIRYLYPPVQQSMNVNLDLTTDAVLERLKNWKKEEAFIVGEENER